MEKDEVANEQKFKKSQAIRAAVHYSVGKILEEVGTEYGMIYSKPVIATISEFVNHMIETYSNDLEDFARHAKRTCINCDDVKLLTRRNPKLKEKVRDISDLLEASGSGIKKRVKKKAKLKVNPSETESREVEIIAE